MTDVAVIGKFSSPEALGAVESTTILVTLFTGFLIGLENGINALIAKYLGQRNSKNVHDALHTSLYLVYIFSWVITAIFEIAYFLYAYKRELKKSNDGDSC